MGVIGAMIRFVLMLAWFREVFRTTLQVSLSCRLTFRWQDLVSLDPCIVLMLLCLIGGSTILLGLICCWLALVFGIVVVVTISLSRIRYSSYAENNPMSKIQEEK